MSATEPHSLLHVAAGKQAIFRELGLDADQVFEHPQIKPWRVLPDRENCTLNADLTNGQRVRWHIKRYAAVAGSTPAEIEVEGIRLLEQAQIATVDLVGYGKLADGRSFLILEDLAGYIAGDKWLEKGNSAEPFIEPVGMLAAKLHKGGLHHRDLYFCHFMLRGDPMDVRLIDAGRVQRLPNGPLAMRWIVKDLAQLWYSLPDDSVRRRVIDQYMERMEWGAGRRQVISWMVRSKSRAIARHDARLRKKQPTRNISLPEGNISNS